MLIIAPVGDRSSLTYTCGICGFVMNEVGECPCCQLKIAALAEGHERRASRHDVLRQVRDLLKGADDGDPE